MTRQPSPAASQSVEDRNLKLGLGQNSRLNRPDLVSNRGQEQASFLKTSLNMDLRTGIF